MNARNPLCLVIGLPFTSYIEELSGTAVASIQRRDSRWFLPMESRSQEKVSFIIFTVFFIESSIEMWLTAKVQQGREVRRAGVHVKTMVTVPAKKQP
ncbi:hypothetical protein NC653_014536 [Populus alba x Populus x berolinensis]|uniref:Uncharacterized protein n=1 Tax=Populus alba x Populus x berolinensis TaxID=444605 RepID=A0AAD6W411_9ROSI|nr:hypothetical protein NC653_014536 [Populus alba x Populus x berolinensis]